MVEAHRLVTLVGPGGVGKTRLLVEVGHRLRAARPDRPVVMCELADGRRGVGGRRRRRGAGDRRPARRRARPSGSPTCSATAEVVLLLDNCEHVLDPVAELVERLLAPLPERDGWWRPAGSGCGCPASRCCAVPTLPAGDDDGAGGRSCSWSGPGPWRPASSPTRGELAVHRRDRAPARRAAAGHRAGRGPAAHPRRRRGGRRARPPLRPAVVGLPHVVPARLAAAPRCRGRSGCSTSACSRRFADLSVFAGSFTAADAAAVCGVDVAARRPPPWPSSPSARWSCGRPTGGTCCWRRCGRSAPSSSPPPAGAERRRRAPRPPPGRLDRARRPAAASSRARPVHRRDRRRHPGAARRARLAARPRRGRARRPARRRPARLRVPAPAARRPGVGGAGDRRRPRRPQPGGAARCGWSRAYAAWMAGDVAETGVRSRRALRGRASGPAATCRPRWPRSAATTSCSRAASTRPSRWYRRAVEPAVDDPAQRLLVGEHRGARPAPTPATRRRRRAADALLAEVGDASTAVRRLRVVLRRRGRPGRRRRAGPGPARPGPRAGRADRTRRSSPASPARRRRRSTPGSATRVAAAEDYRRLIAHWRRAGMWSTQWTMLRSIAGLLGPARAPPRRRRAGGAVRATAAGPPHLRRRRGGARRARRAAARRARRRGLRGGARREGARARRRRRRRARAARSL